MDISDNPNYYFGRRPYKPKLICCICRKVFKRRLATDLNIDAEQERELVCPNCGKEAEYIGPKFQAPKSDNIKARKSIEVLNSLSVLRFMGFASDKIEIPESRKGLTDLLSKMKAENKNAIERWIRFEFNEENKMQIKAFSEINKRIDQHLNK